MENLDCMQVQAQNCTCYRKIAMEWNEAVSLLIEKLQKQKRSKINKSK